MSPRIIHHDEPFDEGTILKLELFERYLEAWFPVFIHRPRTINIFDFFCGPGSDCDGVWGSPLRSLNVLSNFHGKTKDKNIKINLFLSDKNKKYITHLKQSIHEYPSANVEITIKAQEFEAAFKEHYPLMQEQNCANLLILDPCGMLSPEPFDQINKLQRTDFLLFLPSAHIARFKSTQEFKRKWPGIERIDTSNIKLSTKSFCVHALAPIFKGNDREYLLSDFSINKKEKHSTHGIIFGSRDPLGLEKFLRICWAKDKKNGAANFSLDGDIKDCEDQHLLPGVDEGTKKRQFQISFRQSVLNGDIKTNKEAYWEALKAACLPDHARETLIQLKKEKKINGQVRVSYDTIFKKKVVDHIRLR